MGRATKETALERGTTKRKCVDLSSDSDSSPNSHRKRSRYEQKSSEPIACSSRPNRAPLADITSDVAHSPAQLSSSELSDSHVTLSSMSDHSYSVLSTQYDLDDEQDVSFECDDEQALLSNQDLLAEDEEDLLGESEEADLSVANEEELLVEDEEELGEEEELLGVEELEESFEEEQHLDLLADEKLSDVSDDFFPHPSSNNSGNMVCSSPSNVATERSLRGSRSEEEKSSPERSNTQSAISDEHGTITYMGQLTPASPNTSRAMDRRSWKRFRKLSIGVGSDSSSSCPVPELSWTSGVNLWKVMCAKDAATLDVRNPNLFEQQAYLHPRMRAILFDWILEVAELYSLHRETYYLCIDYIDRYLSVVRDVQKKNLQLLGITCLFLAAKVEEIYPPKIDLLANITDGACTVEEIFAMEIAVLKHLQWCLSPLTVNDWLETMLQFMYESTGKLSASKLLLPHFSGAMFKRICQLLDLVTLDVKSLRYSYGVLAATAIYLLVDANLALTVSGLQERNLFECASWMSVYLSVLKKQSPATNDDNDWGNLPMGQTETFLGADNPCIQTHSVTLELYDLAQLAFESENVSTSMPTPKNMILPMTPPPSGSKSGSPEATYSRQNY